MIKKIIIILIIFNVTKIVKASTKDGIIINLKKIKNISFDFKQTVDEKIEEGTCTIQYPKKIYCSYNNFKKKNNCIKWQISCNQKPNNKSIIFISFKENSFKFAFR